MDSDLIQEKSKIMDQVSRILDSPSFVGSIILRDFLNFIVEETLDGRQEGLKEYVIATNVLKKDADFNPQVSAIVRIHARRLRLKLDDYYLKEGKSDLLRISVPKGRYIPVFENNQMADPSSSTEDLQLVSGGEMKPVIAVLPCSLLHHSGQMDALGTIIPRDISIALTKSKELAVLPYDSARTAYERLGNYDDFAAEMGADYILTSTCQKEEEKIICTVELIALRKTQILWAESFYMNYGEKFEAQVYRNMIRKVAAMVCGYRGLVYQDMLKTVTPSDYGKYYAIYWHNKYHSKFSEEAFHEVLGAVNTGLEKNPENAFLHAFKGELFLNMVLMEAEGEVDYLKVGTQMVEEAIGMNQDCQHCYQVMLWANVLHHDKAEADRSIGKMISINPNDVMYLGQAGFGYICMGEYEKGLDMMSEALSMNPYYPWDINVGFALYYIVNKEYKEALYWAKIINRKALFWDPLLRCSILGHLERREEALDAYDEILALMPDFPKNAPAIVSRFVLDKELQASILHGLSLAGAELILDSDQ